MEHYLNIITIVSETLISGGGIVAIIATLVEYSKKNNHKPISWALNKMGTLMTRSVMREVEELNGKFFDEVRDEISQIKTDETKMEERLEKHIEDVEKVMESALAKAQESNLTRCSAVHEEIRQMKGKIDYKVEEAEMKRIRTEIFRFDEGIRNGTKYTEEHWNNMRDDVKAYKKFSEENEKKFINSRCEKAMQNILNTWENNPWE